MNTPDYQPLIDIYELALEGLHTDGAHHKQWFLERILEEATGESIDEWRKYTTLKDQEHGIAP